MLRCVLAAAFGLVAVACTPAVDRTSLAASPVVETPVEGVSDSTDASPAIGERGGMCGGIAGFQCKNADDYCAMEAKACIEIADSAGVCAQKPTICTMDYRPVCGCDGKTYPNACGAAGAGVSIAADGECLPQSE